MWVITSNNGCPGCEITVQPAKQSAWDTYRQMMNSDQQYTLEQWRAAQQAYLLEKDCTPEEWHAAQQAYLREIGAEPNPEADAAELRADTQGILEEMYEHPDGCHCPRCEGEDPGEL